MKKPNVVVFRLLDFTAARHATPLFALPREVAEAPFCAHDIKAKGKSKLFQRIPETKLPKDAIDRGFALTIISLIVEGGESPVAGAGRAGSTRRRTRCSTRRTRASIGRSSARSSRSIARTATSRPLVG